MTDHELAKFLGLADDPRWPQAIAKLEPKKRTAYEHMADVCMRINLFEAGLGPKPEGVILCYDHKRRLVLCSRCRRPRGCRFRPVALRLGGARVGRPA